MKAVIVLAHPKKEGFNRAIAQAVEDALSGAYEVRVVDLYAEGFDPVLSPDELPRKFSFDEKVLDYQEAVKTADRLVFVHPDWWGGPPAILKGFLDRVFRPGVAYGYRGNAPGDAPGLLSGTRADVFVTTDASAPDSGDALDWPPAFVWKDSILDFSGIRDASIHVFWNLRNSAYAERKAWLDAIPAALGARVPA